MLRLYFSTRKPSCPCFTLIFLWLTVLPWKGCFHWVPHFLQLFFKFLEKLTDELDLVGQFLPACLLIVLLEAFFRKGQGDGSSVLGRGGGGGGGGRLPAPGYLTSALRHGDLSLGVIKNTSVEQFLLPPLLSPHPCPRPSWGVAGKAFASKWQVIYPAIGRRNYPNLL